MSGPARRDGFRLRPEMHRLLAVGSEVPQLGGTGPGKAEPGDAHRNRDIDTDLTDVDAVLDVARVATVPAGDCHAIATSAVVDEGDGVGQRIQATAAQQL